MTTKPKSEKIERAVDPDGWKFMLPALEKIAEAPSRLTAAQMSALARRAIAYATTPLDCPGVTIIKSSHLFIGNPSHCAACGLLRSDYLGEVAK